MSNAEKFDVKMVVLRHVKSASNSVFEFIVDDESQSLDELVVSSLRESFKISPNKHRYTMECRDGELMLLKLMKSLKLYEWKAVTSNAFSSPGASGNVETSFYYEKSLNNQPSTPATPSVASKFAFKRPVSQPAHVDHHTHAAEHHPVNTAPAKATSGTEEEKTTTNYASKPLPSVPAVPAVLQKVSAIQAAISNIEKKEVQNSSGHDIPDDSKRASTNREKLLQKYNQHRRASTKNTPDAPETHAQAQVVTESARASVNMNKPPTGAAPAPPSVPTPAPVSSATTATSSNAVPSSSSSAPPQPATQPATQSVETPKINAASAYPSLVRRISSKGFMQVESAGKHPLDGGASHQNESSGAGSGAGIAAAPSASATGSSALPSRPAPVPPPMPPVPPPVAATVAAPPPPVPPVAAPAPPVQAPAPAPVPAPTAAPEVVTSSQQRGDAEGDEEDGDSPDRYLPRIGSSNPLTSPGGLQKFASQRGASFGTPENDPHETSRTNHYSKLGSAFFSGNALGPGARRTGGRGLSGYASMSAMK